MQRQTFGAQQYRSRYSVARHAERVMKIAAATDQPDVAHNGSLELAPLTSACSSEANAIVVALTAVRVRMSQPGLVLSPFDLVHPGNHAQGC